MSYEVKYISIGIDINNDIKVKRSINGLYSIFCCDTYRWIHNITHYSYVELKRSINHLRISGNYNSRGLTYFNVVVNIPTPADVKLDTVSISRSEVQNKQYRKKLLLK